MNIYDLEKKLAARSEGFPECNTHSDYSLARAQVVCRVGAHKCHHFMKALEALKELANRPDCEGPLCHYCDTGLPHPKIGGEETLKLIAELEEVK